MKRKLIPLFLLFILVGCGILVDKPIDTPVKKIIFINLDSVDKNLISNVQKEFEKKFNVETELRDYKIDIQTAYNAERKQYDALKIIEQIDIKPSKEERVFAFTTQNIYSGELSFVFSTTNTSKNIGIISTYYLRLKLGKVLGNGKAQVEGYVDDELLLNRTMKTLLRNFGRTLGFATSSDKNCVMAFSDTLFDLDKKSMDFCGKQIEYLRKLGMYKQ